MPGWVALLAFNAFVLVAVSVWAWRRAMRTDFFFSRQLLDVPAFYAFIYLILNPIFDWFEKREVNLIAELATLAIFSAIYIGVFTLGFIYGKLRSRKNEGIIGQSR